MSSIIFFSTIAEKSAKNIIPTEKTFHEYLKNKNSSIFLSPSTPDEVYKLILQTDTTKYIGPNSIPPKTLKLLAQTISKPISKLVSLSFSTGTFPESMKISEVISIHKKDLKLQCNNYRPTSLLSNISKIYEKLMYTRLYTFLEKFKCLHNLQFGFREKYSTIHTH